MQQQTQPSSKPSGRAIEVEMNILNMFNSVVDFVNSHKDEEIPRTMQVIDIKFKIAMDRLRKIANLRLEQTQDPADPILEQLRLLGIVTMKEVDDDGGHLSS